jgi:hypothetical protein
VTDRSLVGSLSTAVTDSLPGESVRAELSWGWVACFSKRDFVTRDPLIPIRAFADPAEQGFPLAPTAK